MTVTVFMIRHGAHDLLGKTLCGRSASASLNAAGQAQARALAPRLGRAGVSAILTSPIERAWQTAAAIGSELGRAVEVDERLIEIDFGAWSGQAFDALEQDEHWRRWNSERDQIVAPGGEGMTAARDRMIDFLDQAREAHDGQVIAAISHADVIKAALLHVLGLPMQAYGRIEVDPGSVSVVVAADWGCKVHSINEVAA